MRYLLWDFDGTLGYRDGGWSGACAEVLRETGTAPDVDVADVRPHLGEGFPWHSPEDPHTHLSTAEEWWAELYPVLEGALEANGAASPQVRELAERVRTTYVERGWRAFDDANSTLATLSEVGWRHVVLSNHVPELETILGDLGLRDHFEAVHTSAHIGYEKPHPEAFRTALTTIEDDAAVWMIGDSVRADVRGASDVGMPAILVRASNPDIEYVCPDLSGIEAVVADSP